MINTYIEQYNAAIEAKTGEFTALINGICQPIFVVDSDNEVELPMLTVDGESTSPFIDDDYDFGLYHKQNQIAYLEDFTKGFGDNKRTFEVQDLSIIAWCFADKLSKEELKDYLLSVAPEFIRFVSVSFDKKAIFNTEFKNVNFFINEDIHLIKINYKVQYKIQKSCLEINTKFTI